MIAGSESSTLVVTRQEGDERLALTMVTILFFMWGFLTCLNDILVPHLKAIFDLSYAEVMLVQFAFFSSYFLFAVPAGKLVEFVGYKRTMVVSLVVMGAGALMFIPAATAAVFWVFLSALIVLAVGITALQVSANPYVAVLGSPETASSRLNLAQAFNSLGTTVALPLGGWLILSNAPKTAAQMKMLSVEALHAYRMHEASSVKMPYLFIALTLLLLGVAIAMSKLPTIANTSDFRHADVFEHPTRALLRQRQLVFGVIGIFVYVGAEVSIGSFLVNYLSQPYVGGMPEKTAAFYVSLYWGGAMVGRFIGSWVLQWLRTNVVLGWVALAAMVLVATSILSFGHLAMWSMILVGLFNSVMFPSIFTLGIAGLGPLTGKGSGMLVAAIVGGAVIPLLQGVLADHIGIHHAFFIPLACYLYIAFYGFWGSRPSATPAAA